MAGSALWLWIGDAPTPPWAIWGSPWYHRTDQLRPWSFSAMEPQTRAWSEDESGCSLTHTLTLKLLQFSFPPSWRIPWPVELLSEVPGSGSSSPSIQWDRTWLWTDFPGKVLTESGWDCQMSWSTSPWSPSRVKTAQRDGAPLGEKEDLECHRVACHLVQSCVPPYSYAAQLPTSGSRGQLVGILLGPPMLWKYGQTRSQVTLRGVENSDFILMPVDSNVCLCLSTKQRIHKIFKRSYRASGYKNVLRLWCPNQWVRDLRLYRQIGLVVS
jgi:hypothetical protein